MFILFNSEVLRMEVKEGLNRQPIKYGKQRDITVGPRLGCKLLQADVELRIGSNIITDGPEYVLEAS